MCYSILTNIIVPLCAALIGGGLTLLGVRYTIKDQRRKEAENQKLALKPWIFSYDKRQDFDYKNTKEYFMEIEGTFNEGKEPSLIGFIKNTDNGLLILDRIETENNTYYPSSGEVVEKDVAIMLIMVLASDGTETLKDMYLYVKDVLGNMYRYKMILKGDIFKITDCEEV